jgi:hypothetical protein
VGSEMCIRDSPCSSQLLKRQEQGVKKALDLFFAVLNDDMGKIMDYDDISLKMNRDYIASKD